MWTIAELKERGKAAFKANYWKAVLVGLIFALISGSSVTGSSNRNSNESGIRVRSPQLIEGYNELKEKLEEEDHEEFSGEWDELTDEDLGVTIEVEVGEPEDHTYYTFHIGPFTVTTGLALLAVVILMLSLGLAIFVFYPLEVGCYRFYLANLTEPAEVGEVARPFDHAWTNVGLAMLTTKSLMPCGFSC